MRRASRCSMEPDARASTSVGVLAQASLLGSVFSNMLLVLGCCFLFAGIDRKELHFNSTGAVANMSLLLLSSLALVLPTPLSGATVSAPPASCGARGVTRALRCARRRRTATKWCPAARRAEELAERSGLGLREIQRFFPLTWLARPLPPPDRRPTDGPCQEEASVLVVSRCSGLFLLAMYVQLLIFQVTPRFVAFRSPWLAAGGTLNGGGDWGR